jgi:uncharacterized membrane protein YkvA (DUF1232 family)
MEKLNAFSRFKKEIVILFKSYMDKRTPWWVKLIGILTAIYIISPIDLIADFVPILGWVDDITLSMFVIALMAKLVPRHVLDEYREKSKWKR